MTHKKYEKLYEACAICPRKCGANRFEGHRGFCKETSRLRAARAALHMWEEPCISGKEGSGAIFFTGCNLGCVFCQNYEISHEDSGKDLDADRLLQIFYELKEKKANNINLVTSDIYLPTVAEAIEKAKSQGFDLPFVYNTSSYLRVDSLKLLDGLVDIYLPDFKYFTNQKAGKYSLAQDYPEVVKAAIEEMHRQIPACSFDERGMMRKGIIVRHLLMPHGLLEGKMIVKYLHEKYGDSIFISLMNQFTPDKEKLKDYPEISMPVTEREYDELTNYAASLGVTNGFMQEGGTVSESFIPAFNFEGI